MGTDEKTEKPLPFPFVDRDWFLQRIVDVITSLKDKEIDLGVPITVIVGGTTITGHVVPYRTYFQKFGDTFSEGLQSGGMEKRDAEQIAKTFRGIADEVDEGRKIYEEANGAPPTAFVHIEGRIISPSGNIPSNNAKTFFRVRLSEVSAFTLGTF